MFLLIKSTKSIKTGSMLANRWLKPLNGGCSKQTGRHFCRRERFVERSPATMRHPTRCEESSLAAEAVTTWASGVTKLAEKTIQWWHWIVMIGSCRMMLNDLEAPMTDWKRCQEYSGAPHAMKMGGFFLPCRFHSYGISPRLNKLLNAAWLKFAVRLIKRLATSVAMETILFAPR